MKEGCIKPPAVRGERPIIFKAIVLGLQLALIATRILRDLISDC